MIPIIVHLLAGLAVAALLVIALAVVASRVVWLLLRWLTARHEAAGRAYQRIDDDYRAACFRARVMPPDVRGKKREVRHE